METPLQKPTRVPEKGFYYHYKHDPAGPINHYAYEVLGTGMHTEDDCRPVDQFIVTYRPLYDSRVRRMDLDFDERPLGMFMENVTKEGKTFPRFQKITDQVIITELKAVRDQMYG